MNRAARKPLSTFTTSQVVQLFMNETDSDENIDSTDSGSDYEDHMSSVSEHSDVEDANPIDPPATTTVACPPLADDMGAQTVPTRGRGQGRRGRGRGRGRGGSVKGHETTAHTVGQPLCGKDKFRWDHDPPSVGRRREQDIIRQQPGITALARTNANNLADTFQCFITKEMVDNIVLQTKREARRRIRAWNESNPRELRGEWKPVDGVEVRAFIGLFILAGVYRSNHEPVSTLWSEREGKPVFTATMPRNRFSDIIKYLRFDEKASRAERQQTDKLAPFRDIWTMFTDQLPKYYIPGSDLCVDEQLVAFRGKCGFRQYIPSKPAKYGLKIWWCCDANTSYPLTGQVYLGRQPGEQREIGQGARVVRDLISPWRRSGRNIVADNFFTSVPLVQELLVDGLTYTGTIRSNKPQIPPEMKASFNRNDLSSIFGFHDQLTLVSYAPKSGKAVIALSSMHHDKTIDGDAKKPEIILHYNSTKSGVDNLDHLATIYTCRRKVNRWPVVLFNNVIDVAAIAAYIVWLCVNPEWKESEGKRRRAMFLRELGYSLVMPHMELRSSIATLQLPVRYFKHIFPSQFVSTNTLVGSGYYSKLFCLILLIQ